jgi:DNA cross-link repair 1B protein
MDACHCPGAVMFLFKGKMGTVLHTGDFRFHPSMLDNKFLCPPEKKNDEMKGITIDIDYLHLDNTFANPEYDFPSREDDYKSLKEIV